jgi:S1-C subfamily serine protease
MIIGLAVKTNRPKLVRSLGFILCAATLCQSLRADSIPDIVAHSKLAIIEILALDAQNRLLKSGTGFFITSDGVAVTNYHVIQGASSLTAMTNDGAFFAFERVLYSPPGVDLALLKFAAHDAQYLKLGRSDTAVEGQRILVIGNPTGLQGTVSDGLIAAFRQNRSIIQITAPVSPGSSGSPVLDESGLVIGVATLQRIEGQNLNFAIPVESVNAAVASLVAQQGSQQQAQQVPPTPVSSPSGGLVGSEVSKPNLSEFVRDFVTSANYGDSGVESSFYAEEVDYFDDGKVNKEFVVNDIKKYNQRWPRRSYWVDGDPAVKTMNPQGDTVRAVVILKFSVQNGQKTVGGSCENTIFIRDARTNPKVISVKSRFLSRYEKPNR